MARYRATEKAAIQTTAGLTLVRAGEAFTVADDVVPGITWIALDSAAQQAKAGSITAGHTTPVPAGFHGRIFKLAASLGAPAGQTLDEARAYVDARRNT